MILSELLHLPTYFFLAYLFFELQAQKKSLEKIEGHIDALIAKK